MLNPDQHRPPKIKKLNSYLKAIANIHTKGNDLGKYFDFAVQRIRGGSNNALYKIESANGTFACKLCVDDIRQRAYREFGALKIIQAFGLDIAPSPILLDDSKSVLPYPYVIYRWADGIPLQFPCKQQQLESFLGSYHQLHSIKQNQISKVDNSQIPKIPAAWFHWFEYQTYLTEIRELFTLYTPWLFVEQQDGNELTKKLSSLIDELEDVIINTRTDPSQQVIPLRLVRVDPNTTNAIWGPDSVVRWVDWEYCGWGDTALDIAELRWHASLLRSNEDALQWLRNNYIPPSGDPEFNGRLRIWDHILAVRWPLLILRVLWSNHNGPDRERLSIVETSSNLLNQRLKATIQKAENFFSGDEWLIPS